MSSLTVSTAIAGSTLALVAGPPAATVPREPQAQVTPSLARILRPQAAYRWLLPRVAAITPQYIEMVLSGALAGNHVQQWELFSLMEDTWPRLNKNLDEIKNAVRGLKLTFEAYCEEDEEPSPDAEERCATVAAAVRNMRPEAAADENASQGTVFDILDAWAKGVSVLEIEWHRFESAKLGTVIGPRATFWVHPVCYAWNRDGRVGLRTDARGNVSPAQAGTATVGEFPEEKFLIGICKARSGGALGGARLRALAWWWCAANFSADWLLNLAQVFGLPFRWANYDPNAPQATIDAICNMLQNMGSAGWAAFPAGTTLDLKEASKGNNETPQGDMLDRADKNCDLLILGQTLTSDSGGMGQGGGSLALGKVHEGVKAQIITAAATFAAEVFNHQLFPSILRLNFGDDTLCPSCSFKSEEEDDLTMRATIISTLTKAGAAHLIGDDYISKTFDIPKPAAGERTLADGAAERAPEINQDEEGVEVDLQAGEATGHPFRGNQHTGGRGAGMHKPPRRISAEEADRILSKGVTEKDKSGGSVHFGPRLKTKLESKPEYAGRKELLQWGRETVRTGNKIRANENGEDRDYYGKFFSQAGAEKGMMVIVSAKDGEAFNIFRAPRKYLRSKGLASHDAGEMDEPGEQPPVAVLQAIAAASGLPDYFDDTLAPEEVKTLERIAGIKDDALFAKALEAFTKR